MNNQPFTPIEFRIDVLRKVRTFAETDDHVLRYIASAMNDVMIVAHEPVFVKGDRGDSMYIIVKGEVRVHDGDHIFNTLYDSDAFGEYSLFDSSERTASVTANCDTQLLSLDQDTFFQLLTTERDLMQGFLGTLIRRVKDKDNLEEELAQRNAEIMMQKEEIEAQRDEIQRQRDVVMQQKKEITDSIRYARRIQQALLPPDKYLKSILPEHFILNRPRDIVSGDYYWMAQKDEKLIVTVADCTGHGVPGAFMSMLGVAFLNEIINKSEFEKASEVLNKLRDTVKISLRQTEAESQTKDGMDIAFCIIDLKTKILQYSGAYNPLYIIRKVPDNVYIYNGNEVAAEGSRNDVFELIELKADRMPIGVHLREAESFTNHSLQLLNGDNIYIFSDGYMDQFGGPLGRKFLSKNLKQLLLSIQSNNMIEQRYILEKRLEEWMGDYPQVDDVMVLGIKV